MEEPPESVNDLGIYLYLQRLAEGEGHRTEVPLCSTPKLTEERLPVHQEAAR